MNLKLVCKDALISIWTYPQKKCAKSMSPQLILRMGPNRKYIPRLSNLQIKHMLQSMSFSTSVYKDRRVALKVRKKGLHFKKLM